MNRTIYDDDFCETFNSVFADSSVIIPENGPARVQLLNKARDRAFGFNPNSNDAKSYSAEVVQRATVLFAVLLRDTVRTAPKLLNAIDVDCGTEEELREFQFDEELRDLLVDMPPRLSYDSYDCELTQRVDVEETDENARKKPKHPQVKSVKNNLVQSFGFNNDLCIELLEYLVMKKADPLLKWSAYSSLYWIVKQLKGNKIAQSFKKQVFFVADEILAQESVDQSLVNNVTFNMLHYSGQSFFGDTLSMVTQRGDSDSVATLLGYLSGDEQSWDNYLEGSVSPVGINALLRAKDQAGIIKALGNHVYYYNVYNWTESINRAAKNSKIYNTQESIFAGNDSPSDFMDFAINNLEMLDRYAPVRTWCAKQYALGHTMSTYYLSQVDMNAILSYLIYIEPYEIFRGNVYFLILAAYLRKIDPEKFDVFMQSFVELAQETPDYQELREMLFLMYTSNFVELIITTDVETIRNLPLSLLLAMI